MTSVDANESSNERVAGCPVISASSVRLIDILEEKPVIWRAGGKQMLVLLTAGFLILVIGIVAAEIGFSSVARIVIAFGAVAPFAFLASRLLDPSRRVLTQTIERIGRDNAILESMNKPLAVNAHRGVALMLGAVLAHGQRGVLYRVLPSSELRDCEPINVPFEPTVVDESDDRVVALMREASSDSASAPLSPLNRNVRRTGGWVIACISGFMAAVELYRSVATGKATGGLFLFTCFLLMSLLGGWRNWFLPTFLAVPGGIITRKLFHGLRRESSVHLYSAMDSVLCVYRETRKLWILAIADRIDVQWTLCTPTEAKFAMAAWISPIAPPTIEQLSEL